MAGGVVREGGGRIVGGSAGDRVVAELRSRRARGAVIDGGGVVVEVGRARVDPVAEGPLHLEARGPGGALRRVGQQVGGARRRVHAREGGPPVEGGVPRGPEVDVLVEDLLEGVAVEELGAREQAPEPEVAVVGHVVAQQRGELEVGIDEVVLVAGGAGRVPDRRRLVVGVGVEGDPIARRCAMTLSRANWIPVPEKLLESQTYGVRPVKTPIPPRTWFFPFFGDVPVEAQAGRELGRARHHVGRVVEELLRPRVVEGRVARSGACRCARPGSG